MASKGKPVGSNPTPRRKRPGGTDEAATARAENARGRAERAVGPTRTPLIVVGIGMSAGGFEACSELLGALPARPGFAIVIVQHLAPTTRARCRGCSTRARRCPSSRRRTAMTIEREPRVRDPAERAHRARGRAPARAAAQRPTRDRPLPRRLLPRVAGGPARATARSRSSSPAWARDGVEGAARREGAGRDRARAGPGTARFDSMPRAAIGTGLADARAPAGRARRTSSSRSRATPYAADPPSPGPRDLQIAEAQSEQLVELLREASGGVDFSHYKQPTIKRRILRRMALNRVERPRRLPRAPAAAPGGGAQPLPGPAHPRHALLPRARVVRGDRARGAAALLARRQGRRSPCASGSPAAPPARRPTRSRSRSSSWPARRRPS